MTLTASATSTEAPTTGSTALAWRRWALILSPVLGGLFIAAAAAVDPGAGLDGRELWVKYGSETDLQQLHTNLLHWGFGFFGISALFVGHLVRGRGAWLANLGVALGFAGVITLPGLVAVDFFNGAITQVHGADATVAVEAQIDTMWGLGAFALPGMVGLIAGPVLGAAALALAGRVSWLAPAAIIASFVAINVSHFTLWGGVVMTALLTVYAVELHRATAGGGRTQG